MSVAGWVALVGGIATLCSSFALLPQILKTRKDGGRDLSYGMLLLYLAGAVMWLAYGTLSGATAVAIANVIATTLVSILIVTKWALGRRAAAAPRRLRIAIDMDETIVDILPKHLGLYNAAFGENVTVADLAGVELEHYVPRERAAATEQMILERSFFRDLPFIEGARETVKELAERHEVYIATAAMDVPTSFDAKYAWLREQMPFIPTSHIIFCGDKGALDMDYLIDDRSRHFARFRGQGILFDAPHNREVTGYPRAKGWAEVRRMLLDPPPAEKAPAAAKVLVAS